MAKEKGLKRLRKLSTNEGNIERHSRIAEMLSIAISCTNQAKALIPIVPSTNPKQVSQADRAVTNLAEAVDLLNDVFDAVQHYVNSMIR